MADDPDEVLGLEPSDAEIEEWAARERQRREAWLRGPSDAQKAIWAERERRRRGGEGFGGGPMSITAAEPIRMAQFALREVQLATEGAVSMVFKLSIRDVLDQLVRAGREWEDEYTSRPARRRRVAHEVDTDEAEMRPARPPQRPTESPGPTTQPG